jgi:hypothetical protein
MATIIVDVHDFLTHPEVRKARRIFDAQGIEAASKAHARCRDEIIIPALARINKTLGQENDPDYLAYLVEYLVANEEA